MGKCFQHFLGHLECPNEKVKENGLVTKSSILSMESLGWPNTQIQIHKYTNTNTQIHKYKYNMCGLLKRASGFKGIQLG